MTRLEELLLKWRHGLLSGDELRELNSLLGNSGARAGLVREFQFDALIRGVLRQQVAVAAARAAAKSFKSAEVIAPAFTRNESWRGRVTGWFHSGGIRYALPLGAAAVLTLLVAWFWVRSTAHLLVLRADGGSAMVLRDGRSFTNLPAGFTLHPGDEVVLANTGTVRLADRAGTMSVKLDGPGRLKLDESGEPDVLLLASGSLSINADTAIPLIIRSAGGEVSARNAEFTLHADDQQARLEVESGHAEWRRYDDGRLLSVAGGQFAVLGSGLDFLAKSLLPEPWLTQTVGEVASRAHARFDGSTVRLVNSDNTRRGPQRSPRSNSSGKGQRKAKGRDSGGDGFHFVYRRLEGDGEIRARVVADARGSEVEAGLAIRRDLTADAPMAFVGNRSGRSLELRRSLRRVTPRGLEEKRGGSYWVRLVRDGKTVTAYRSDDGQLWKETGSGKMDLGPTAFVGFAATSAQDASPHPAVVFDNVIFIAAR